MSRDPCVSVYWLYKTQRCLSDRLTICSSVCSWLWIIHFKSHFHATLQRLPLKVAFPCTSSKTPTVWLNIVCLLLQTPMRMVCAIISWNSIKAKHAFHHTSISHNPQSRPVEYVCRCVGCKYAIIWDAWVNVGVWWCNAIIASNLIEWH